MQLLAKCLALGVCVITASTANANWTTKRVKDPMGGPSSTDLCTISKNSVSQNFPYNRGKTSMRLCVSKTGDSYETYITVNQGQIMCHTGTEVFQIRADEKESRKMRCSPTSDGSYDQAYFYEGFESVKEIISATDVIRIKVDLYSYGSVVFEFKPIGRALPSNFKSPLM
jgi:hypothetical protein